MALHDQLQQSIAYLDLASHLIIGGTIIGGGAFGDVVKGYYAGGRGGVVKVAVKRLRTLRKDDWHILEKEVYVWSKLNHDNILSLMGYCIDNATGAPMLVSELMENGTAWEYMKLNPNADLLHLITGIARGLKYLHESDVIHSDIKSDNVLVSASGDARICDFGCARMISASLNIANLSQTPKGTLRYLAYELLREQTSYTMQTDVWAFGMVIFELMSLRRPYATLTDAQAIAAIQRCELPSFPTTFTRNLHHRCANLLRHICQCCWRFQASNRPAMSDVVKSLDWQMERREKTAEYKLRVIRLKVAHSASDRPCVYVELKVHGKVLTTPTIKATEPPVWNETFVFTASEATVIEIRVNQRLQHSNIDQCVGEAKVKVEDLMEKSACGEAQLDLSMPSNGVTCPMSGVYVYLKDIDAERRVGIDIENARNDIQGTSPSPAAVRFLTQQLEHIMEAINVFAIKVEPYINLAWHAASALYKVVSRFSNVDEKIVDLVHTMEQALEFAHVPRTLADRISDLREIVDEVLKQAVECFRFAERGSDRCDIAIGANYDELVVKYKSRFLELKRSLDNGIAHSAAVPDSDDDLRHELEWLEKQLYPIKTDISSRPRCLHSTRRSYLDQIMTWLSSDTKQNIFCLTGVAGSGKSTIAATIVDRCDVKDCLSAHIFFERGRTNQGSIIRTIAWMLAEFSPSLAHHVIAAVRDNRNILDAPATKQFERLVLDPLKATRQIIWDPMIVVLDALDECGTMPERREVMRLLKTEFPNLMPFKVRFLVTSRPEDDIVKAVSQQEHIFSVALDHNSAESRSDIHTYLEHAIHAAVPRPVLGNFTMDEKVQLLAESAKGLFIWASTAVNMVSTSDDPIGRLEQLVSNNRSLHELGLYGLYAIALRQSGISWHDAMSKQRTVKVLGLVLFTKEALPDTVMDKVLDMGAGKSRLTLQRLRSVVYYEPGKPVHLHHASFAEYITSPEHSGDSEWFIEVDNHKRAIASRCFGIMENILRFNICDFENSVFSNEDVADLQHRIEDRIPPHLSYACRFWSEHVCEVPRSEEAHTLLNQLNRFAYQHLMYWFEVLSLTGYFTRIASLSLYNTSVWTSADDSELSSFLWDAYKLAGSFALPISQSAPHIYLSALSLRKGESAVSDHYSSAYPTIRVRVVGSKARDPCIKIMKGHANTVYAVAVSADGRHVASGDQDGSVRIWDAESGELVLNPLVTTSKIVSVAFMSDGKRVAAVAQDGSICVWNIESGELVHGPFKCHSKDVNATRFSPDGKSVATGFWDGSIRVWNVENGSLVLGPLKEYMIGVSTLAFSPKGEFLASGSYGHPIRIWDLKSGATICELLLGHTKCVWSVDVSPDRKYAASGHYDGTVCVWELDSGKAILGPLKGHRNAIPSVVYSPDGKRIVSGSVDQTIRIWNAVNGELVSGPLMGHLNGVQTVVFFPDGKRIVSGSSDDTVRIWEVQSNTVEPRTPEGHKGSVKSVAFSPDGLHIVSGSRDGSIYVWDVQTSRIVLAPPKIHTKRVTCVTYSPDGKRFASASDDESVRIWSSESGEEVLSPLEGHANEVKSVSFSLDGKRLASACSSRECSILVWHVESGAVVLGPLKLQTASVESIMFSPDGDRIVSGCGDCTIRVWDANSGEVVLGPLKGHTELVTSVKFSPDGRRIASGSWDKTIRIWCSQTGALISGPFEGHTDEVMSVSFSPDGKQVVSGSEDCSVRIWNVESGQTILPLLMGHAFWVSSVAFSPCGKHVASGSDDGKIRVWKLDDCKTLANAGNTQTESNSSRSMCPSLVNNTTAQQAVASPNFPGMRGAGMSSTWPRECAAASWKMSDDGWLCGDNGELLIWLPEDMRLTVCHPCNTAILNCEYWTELDFAESPLGKGWSEGYPLSQPKSISGSVRP